MIPQILLVAYDPTIEDSLADDLEGSLSPSIVIDNELDIGLGTPRQAIDSDPQLLLAVPGSNPYRY